MIEQKVITLETTQQNNDCAIQAKLLGQEQRSNHFNDFKLLQIEIKNKSNSPLTFTKNSISLPLASATEVLKKEPKIYTAYFIPAFLSLIGSYFFLYQLALPLTIGCSLIAGHASGKVNYANSNHLKKISFFHDDQLIIEPKNCKNFLLFIPKNEYKPEFAIQTTFPDGTTTSIKLHIQATTLQQFIVQG